MTAKREFLEYMLQLNRRIGRRIYLAWLRERESMQLPDEFLDNMLLENKHPIFNGDGTIIWVESERCGVAPHEYA